MIPKWKSLFKFLFLVVWMKIVHQEADVKDYLEPVKKNYWLFETFVSWMT